MNIRARPAARIGAAVHEQVGADVVLLFGNGMLDKTWLTTERPMQSTDTRSLLCS